MTAAAWYFVKEESVQGPVDRMTMMEHTFSGHVEAETLVWSEWDERPRPIHATPEFSNFLSAEAIDASPDASRAQSAPLTARVAAGSWILLGGLMLVMLMMFGFMTFSRAGGSLWTTATLVLCAIAATLLIREGHLTIQGYRASLRTCGLATSVAGAAGLILTFTVATVGGFGGLAILATFLLASGLAALWVDSEHRRWYGSGRG